MNVLSHRVEATHIERAVYLDASVADVWQAVINEAKFGEWFCASLSAPFRVGEVTYGHSTYPGCESFRWRAVTETIDHERLLIFTWRPAPVDVPLDELRAIETRVELSVRATVDGTRVTFRETGFEYLEEAGNLDELVSVREQGWRLQGNNLRDFFKKKAR